MKKATLRLRRWWPPGTKKVSVGPITVGGYMTLVQYAATRAAEVRLASTKDITGEDLIRALRNPDWVFFADLICLGEEPGFFERWITLENVRALLAASGQATNWSRVLGCLNLDPSTPPRKGSLMDDVVAVCKALPGNAVAEVLAMSMEGFLDVIETLNREAMAMDPTSDPDAMPSEAFDLASIPGVGVVQ